jgi:hypothetical protein
VPIYEFECPRGHVTEALKPMGTQRVLCLECEVEYEDGPLDQLFATRILSPTRTDFRYADRSLKR